MNLADLFEHENISVRSRNVCEDNGIIDLTTLIDYFNENGSFLNLRNCGAKSNLELISFCQKLLPNKTDIKVQIKLEINPIIEAISKLNRAQREIINIFIEVNFKNLSIRSQNALSKLLNHNLKIKSFAESIYINQNFNFKSTRNIGAKSVVELNSFKNSLTSLIFEVCKIENDSELAILKNKYFLERTFSIQNIPDEIILSDSLFVLVKFLIDQNLLFEKNTNDIFKSSLQIFSDKPVLSLDQVAQECNLTRERVRQKRKYCLEVLFDKLDFIESFEEDLYQRYNIDISNDYVDISTETAGLINEINKTNFSKEFIKFLIYRSNTNSIALIGNIEDVLQKNYFKNRNRHNWKDFYLINKKCSSEFDFLSFADDIQSRLNEKIDETYYFNFKGYLSNFLYSVSITSMNEIYSIAEKILNAEFELYLDLDENLIFQRNLFKQVPEYAIEALEKLGKPSKITEIYNTIAFEYPDVTKSEDALRGSLQRAPEIIYFGRSSTYGLKKWEYEKDDIKGGTIKNIIFEYLSEKSEPVHIAELLHVVLKYRDNTTSKNIITNLKLDPQKKFTIFNQNFVGIRGRSYDSNLTNLPKFLGKKLSGYIREKGKIERHEFEKWFAKELNISEINISYIVEHLIENEFIKVDNSNYLLP